MSTRWQPVRGRTVADNRCASDVNIEATDGHSALQGAHVVRPLTVANYLPLDTTRMPYYTSPTRVHEVFRHIVASIRSYGSTGPRARCNLFR